MCTRSCLSRAGLEGTTSNVAPVCPAAASPPVLSSPPISSPAEVASEEGKVELPLCAECAAEVHKELEGQLAELQQVGRLRWAGLPCVG